jgi:hypothetical protein
MNCEIRWLCSGGEMKVFEEGFFFPLIYDDFGILCDFDNLFG